MQDSESSSYEPVNDPIYMLGKLPARIDASTVSRTAVVYPGTNCVGSPGNPVQKNGTTQFRLDCSSAQPFRWNTMGLKIRGRVLKWTPEGTPATSVAAPVYGGDLTTAHNPLAGTPYDSVDPWMIASCIKKITLSIGGTNIINTQEDAFRDTFWAGMITNYSREALENHPALFAPIFDESLTAASGRNGGASNAANEWDAFKANGSCPWRPNDVDTAGGPFYAGTIPALGEHKPHDANFTKTSIITDNYNLASCKAAIERAKRHIGRNSHQKFIERIIPLQDLTNIRYPGMLTNAQDLKLDITWNPSTDVMTHFSLSTAMGAGGVDVAGGSAPNNVWSQFVIENVEIVTDQYMPMPSIRDDDTQLKVAGETDKLVFEQINVQKLPYTPGTQIVAAATPNLQRVIVANFAKGQSNGQNGVFAAGAAGAGDPGGAHGGTKAMVYNSPSQTLWVGNAACTDANYPFMRTSNSEVPTGGTNPATSVSILYNNQAFPTSDVVTGDGPAFIADRLYHEYSKAVCRADKHETSPAIPYEVFRNTMPFFCVKPFSDNAPHLNQNGGSLVVRLQGGAPCVLTIITFQLRIWNILPSMGRVESPL